MEKTIASAMMTQIETSLRKACGARDAVHELRKRLGTHGRDAVAICSDYEALQAEVKTFVPDGNLVRLGEQIAVVGRKFEAIEGRLAALPTVTALLDSMLGKDRPKRRRDDVDADSDADGEEAPLAQPPPPKRARTDVKREPAVVQRSVQKKITKPRSARNLRHADDGQQLCHQGTCRRPVFGVPTRGRPHHATCLEHHAKKRWKRHLIKLAIVAEIEKEEAGAGEEGHDDDDQPKQKKKRSWQPKRTPDGKIIMPVAGPLELYGQHLDETYTYLKFTKPPDTPLRDDALYAAAVPSSDDENNE